MLLVSARSVGVFGAALAVSTCLTLTACSDQAGTGGPGARLASTDSPAAAGTAAPRRPGLAVSPSPPAPSIASRSASAKAGSGSATAGAGSGPAQSRPAWSGAARSASGASSRPPAGSGRWKLNWSDTFDGSSLGSGWGRYDAPIASMPGGRWSSDQVEVAGGMLNLHSSKSGGQWTSGGVMNYGSAQQTYGKYLVRFRMEKAPGVKYAIILWPASGVWPNDGEIDFGEDGGGNRSATTATVHWGTSSSHHQSLRDVRADFSSWHTIGVEWTPGKLVYTLDGRAYGSVKGSFVPTRPMNLVLQTEAGSCGAYMTCADSTTPAVTTMNVDWVAAYRRR